MRTLLLILICASILGCTPNSQTVCHDVRYEANGSSPYNLQYTNSTEGWQQYDDLTGSWDLEYNACSSLTDPHLAHLSVTSPFGDIGSFSVKIFLNGSLWKEASGNTSATIQDNLPFN